MTFAIRLLVATTCVLAAPAYAYLDTINERMLISCVSTETSAQARFADYDGPEKANRVRSWFTRWLFGENNNAIKSKVDFVWRPRTEKGPDIQIVTNEKPHNLVSLRSKTRESLIVVSSASSPMTTESWTFAINFNLESMIATRVQSNYSGIRGEVLNYDCTFRQTAPELDPDTDSTPIG